MAWLTGWRYRRPITIDNTQNSNDLTDYQSFVTVDTASLIQQGKMQTDGDDIRFTDSDGTTLLPYWLEGPINASNTKIWVKVPSIPAGGTKTIYFYYGNPSASSESSIADTFIRKIDGLIGCWHLDEGSGNIANDSSGNNRHGTIKGTTWVSGRFGHALSFDGVDDYINNIQLPIRRSGSQIHSIVVWFKTSASSTGPVYMFGDSNKLGGSNSADEPLGWRSGNGNFSASIYTSGHIYATANQTYRDEKWHLSTVVLDKLSLRLYVDAVLVAENTNANASNAFSYPNNPYFWIGTRSKDSSNDIDNVKFYNGILDEIFVFNIALTTPEISDLYNYYGYTTPNYPGRVLVRKRIDPEPTTSVGNEETESISTSTHIFIAY